MVVHHGGQGARGAARPAALPPQRAHTRTLGPQRAAPPIGVAEPFFGLQGKTLTAFPLSRLYILGEIHRETWHGSSRPQQTIRAFPSGHIAFGKWKKKNGGCFTNPSRAFDLHGQRYPLDFPVFHFQRVYQICQSMFSRTRPCFGKLHFVLQRRYFRLKGFHLLFRIVRP